MASDAQIDQGERTRDAVLEAYKMGDDPSMREVAEAVGLAPSAVKKHVDRLVRAGRLEAVVWGRRYKYRYAGEGS